MPNPYGWGQNEPQIKPKDQGGDTIATFSQKIYNLFDNLFNTLNSYPWSSATQSDAGYMSATDKRRLDQLYTNGEITNATINTNVATGECSYRKIGNLAIAAIRFKSGQVFSTYSGYKIASGFPPHPAMPGDLSGSYFPTSFVFFDSSTFYSAWVSIDSVGNAYLYPRAVAIPQNLVCYAYVIYPYTSMI